MLMFSGHYENDSAAIVMKCIIHRNDGESITMFPSISVCCVASAAYQQVDERITQNWAQSKHLSKVKYDKWVDQEIFTNQNPKEQDLLN